MSTLVPGTSTSDALATPSIKDVLVVVAAAGIAIACVHQLRGLFGPVLLALVIVITVQPLRTVLDRRLPTWASFTVCLLTVYGVLIGFLIAIGFALANFARLVRENGSAMDERLQELGQRLQDLGFSGTQAVAIKDSFDSTRLDDILLSLADTALGIVGRVSLMFAVILFMAIDASRFPYRLADVAHLRPPLVDAMRGFAQSTRRYLVVSTVFGLIVAALDTAALWIMGIPAPLLWGLLAFLKLHPEHRLLHRPDTARLPRVPPIWTSPDGDRDHRLRRAQHGHPVRHPA